MHRSAIQCINCSMFFAVSETRWQPERWSRMCWQEEHIVWFQVQHRMQNQRCLMMMPCELEFILKPRYKNVTIIIACNAITFNCVITTCCAQPISYQLHILQIDNWPMLCSTAVVFLWASVYVYMMCLFLQLIGSMEVPRPANRVEIVAAMRTVRVCWMFCT